MTRPSSLLLTLTLACAAHPALAQQGATDWLASAPAREFRMRVAQLAVIYAESRGVDLHGFLVTGQRIGHPPSDCADVAIVVLDKEREVLREQLRACRHGEPR